MKLILDGSELKAYADNRKKNGGYLGSYYINVENVNINDLIIFHDEMLSFEKALQLFEGGIK